MSTGSVSNWKVAVGGVHLHHVFALKKMALDCGFKKKSSAHLQHARKGCAHICQADSLSRMSWQRGHRQGSGGICQPCMNLSRLHRRELEGLKRSLSLIASCFKAQLSHVWLH